MPMEFTSVHRNKYKMKTRELLEDVEIGVNSESVLTIELLDSRVLRLVSRSLFVIIVLLTLPSFLSIINRSSNILLDYSDMEPDSSDFRALSFAFRDLTEEGFLKKGQRGLIVTMPGIGDSPQDLQFLNDNDLDLVIQSDFDLQNTIPDETYDFVLMENFQGLWFGDRVLEIGGIAIVQLSDDSSDKFQMQSNYKVVYIRKYDFTVIAMRKIGFLDGSKNSQSKRKLCGVNKKVALEGLEDVLLEPPRRALAETSNAPEEIKFLPDLLGDSLRSYSRRIFITDAKNGVLEWFNKNYPTRNQQFESYNLEVDVYNVEGKNKESSDETVSPVRTEVSDWFLHNVKEEDYIVMKAEAQVVEDMIEKKTICLVDELFLECKNQWQEGKEGRKNKRAYWQCLSLYGRLIDEGVAVHQWWD